MLPARLNYLECKSPVLKDFEDGNQQSSDHMAQSQIGGLTGPQKLGGVSGMELLDISSQKQFLCTKEFSPSQPRLSILDKSHFGKSVLVVD
jgi:hypothetical protein